MNKQFTSLTGITTEDFEEWCKENGKSRYSRVIKKKFCKDVLFGKLLKNKETGKIERKK